LGVTPGTYEWTWGTGLPNQKFTLIIGQAGVPDGGSAVALLGICLGVIEFIRRKIPVCVVISLGAWMCSAASLQATVYHSDGTLASVQALHNIASNGDTVTMPPGTFTWTSGVTLTKSITLQGAGVGHTIIRDAVGNNAHKALINWNYS